MLRLSLFATLFFMGQAHPQDGSPEKISTDQELISQLVPHMASGNVKSMPEFRATYSSVARGNFGSTTKFSETIKLEQLASGLYEVQGNSSNAEGSWGDRTGISLCGLVNVLAVDRGRSVIVGAMTTAGIYMEFRSSIAGTNSSRLVALETSPISLCNLEPGTQFKYRYQGISRTHMNRSVLADKKLEFENYSENSCKVSSTKLAASDISPLLVGDYVEVSCTAIPKKGPKIETTWAYLIEHHYYLALKSNTGSARTQFTYSPSN